MKPIGLKFEIKSWRPRRHPKWKIDQHGSTDAEVITDQGIVSFYSFPGDERNSAFTKFEMLFEGEFYSARFDKYYKPMWTYRLCRWFAWEVFQKTRG